MKRGHSLGQWSVYSLSGSNTQGGHVALSGNTGDAVTGGFIHNIMKKNVFVQGVKGS